jgi:RNA recognition motif-containing protein
MKLYVGNIPRQATEEELREAFIPYGEVASVAVIKDKFTGESRGFAFVEMPSDTEAQAAIAGMHGKDWKGRTLTVNEARPKEPREPRFGGGERRGGFRGSGDRDRRSRGSDRDKRGGGGRRSW